MSYVRTLTICLLLVYFVSAAGCHCFDLIVSEMWVIEVCVFMLILYVAGKKCQPQHKTMEKQNFQKLIILKQEYRHIRS